MMANGSASQAPCWFSIQIHRDPEGVCLSVISYLHLATCGPKGHGSDGWRCVHIPPPSSTPCSNPRATMLSVGLAGIRTHDT